MTAQEDTSNDDREVPVDPHVRPQQTVDALEERVLGRPRTETSGDEEAEAPPAVVEQDLDREDMGTADAGSEPTG